MKLRRVHLKNFRAISELTVELGQHTVLLGANGVGKSCLIKAVDKFFSKSPTVNVEDFHNKNVAEPIEITLTFFEFTEEERVQFAGRIHNEEMAVSRLLVAGAAPRDNGKYFGQTPRHQGFAHIRSANGAMAKREAYANQQAVPGYENLPNTTSEATVLNALEVWETENPDQCILDKDDGQFFGFTNVGRGILQKYVSFVFVPAIRDASADAVDKGNTVIAQLIELIVKTVVQRREDFKTWQARATAEYKELVSPENLGELGGLGNALTTTLKDFYSDTEVDLAWQPPDDFSIALPAAAVSLTEQGYAGPVEGKGHGLQRAFIFTILQHLANAIQEANKEKEVEAQEGEGLADGEPDQTNHSLILAIEEPELYQHPTKQRHLARVLSEISAGKIQGVMGQTQILICSHSPYFVSTERFADVRLARRQIDGEGANHCQVSKVTNAEVCAKLNEGLQLDPQTGYQEDSLVARLHILDPLVAEGFFAEVAVLVEGVGDRAALTAVAAARNISFEAEGIALLPVNGKLNLARPLVVFSSLGIPVYSIFDSDAALKPADQHPEANIGIQRLSGENNPVDFRTHVGERFASFENCLEDVLTAELGQEFENQVSLANYKYGLPRKRLLKSPVSLGDIVRGCGAAGVESATLNGIVDAIIGLK